MHVRLELVFLLESKGDGRRPQTASERRIDRKARIGIEHFVARLDQRHHPERERHFAARRHQDLLRRCIYAARALQDRKSTRLNSSHLVISYAVFCLKKKIEENDDTSEP